MDVFISLLFAAGTFAGCYLMSLALTNFHRSYTIRIERRQPTTASLHEPPPPNYPFMQPRPHRVRTGTQVLGSTTTYYPKPRTYTITDADAWLLWQQGVLQDAGCRAVFCAKTGMSQQRWARARQMLIAQHLIDGDNKRIVEQRQVIRAELIR